MAFYVSKELEDLFPADFEAMVTSRENEELEISRDKLLTAALYLEKGHQRFTVEFETTDGAAQEFLGDLLGKKIRMSNFFPRRRLSVERVEVRALGPTVLLEGSVLNT